MRFFVKIKIFSKISKRKTFSFFQNNIVYSKKFSSFQLKRTNKKFICFLCKIDNIKKFKSI